MEPACKVCKSKTKFLGNIPFNRGNEGELNQKSPPGGESIPYFICSQCGFIFTSWFDKWNRKDFLEYIYNDAFFSGNIVGHGKNEEENAVRPKYSPSYIDGLKLNDLIENFISQNLLKKPKNELKILDYGSGVGDTAKALIDNRCNVTCFDPFADDSQLNVNNFHFDIIYLIEVIEHCHELPEVVNFLKQNLTAEGILLMSTNLHSFPPPSNIIDSWYITPRTGHVSIFTFRALFKLFKKVDIYLVETETVIFGKNTSGLS